MHLASIVSITSLLTFVMNAVQIRADLLQTKRTASTGRPSSYLELEFILECTKISVSIINFPGRILTHCGRVTQICVFNTVKLGTSASSP